MVASESTTQDQTSPDSPSTETRLSTRRVGISSHKPKTLSVGELERALLSVFPASDALDWDRTGLLVGDPATTVTKVALALDPTVAAVREAAKAKAQVLITHHPAFLDAPDSFRPADSPAVCNGAVVWEAIHRGVALMDFHTALDVSPRAAGVLAGMLGLVPTGEVLEPIDAAKTKGFAPVSVVRESDRPLTLQRLAARATAVFGRQPRVWGAFPTRVEKVATCTGSASGVSAHLLDADVDCLVCGEIKYHDALDCASAGLCIVELGHDVSELPLVAVLVEAVIEAGVRESAVVLIDQGHNWSYPEATRV